MLGLDPELSVAGEQVWRRTAELESCEYASQNRGKLDDCRLRDDG